MSDPKAIIARTGEANLVLFNDYDESVNVGAVYTMVNRHDRLHLGWRVPPHQHTSPYTKALLYQDKGRVIWTDEIRPLRADNDKKRAIKFDLEFD